jgi:hypothetical protein
MPRTEVITRTVYQYAELTDTAKAKARDWYREGQEVSLDWALEDYQETLKAFGVNLDKHGVCYSGFWSQGDGLSFTGEWTYQTSTREWLKGHRPEDADLRTILDRLASARALAPCDITASITRTSHYYVHAGTVNIDVYLEHDLPVDTDIVAGVTDGLRALMVYGYRLLQTEHEYQTSDEAVAETIEANEYEFLADGRRAPTCD